MHGRTIKHYIFKIPARARLAPVVVIAMGPDVKVMSMIVDGLKSSASNALRVLDTALVLDGSSMDHAFDATSAWDDAAAICNWPFVGQSEIGALFVEDAAVGAIASNFVSDAGTCR